MSNLLKRFLDEIKLEKYFDTFVDNEIEFSELPKMSEDDFFEVVNEKKDAKIIYEKIKEFNKSHSNIENQRTKLEKLLGQSKCKKYLPNFVSSGITDNDLITLKDDLEKLKKMIKLKFKREKFIKYLKRSFSDGEISKKEVLSLAKISFDEEAKKKLKMYIMPRGSERMDDNDSKFFKVVPKVNVFLKDESKKVLLILGDAGAGKSIFGRYFQQQEFSAKSHGRIPLFIRLTSVENPTKFLLNKYLEEQMGIAKKEVRYVLNHYPLLLILDGFDEVNPKHRRNLFRLNMFGSLPNVKIIITCRTSALMQFKGRRNHLEFFAPVGENGYEFEKLSQIVIRPFSSSNIKEYVTKYVEKKKSKWNVEQYLNVIKNNNLNELLSNPFLLYVGLGNLSTLSKEEKKITRYLMYESFLNKWFNREKGKLTNKNKIIEESVMILFCELIAVELYKKNSNTFFFTKEIFEDPNILIDLQSNWTQEERKWIDFFFVKMKQKFKGKKNVIDLMNCCPLNKIGSSRYQFLHKSFYEFIISCAILKEVLKGNTMEDKIRILNMKYLNSEQSIIYFIKDIVKHNDIYVNYFLSIIKNSRNKNNVTISSANAATILNFSNVSFSKMHLQGIKIDGADMNGSILYGTDLSNSSLQNVDFRESNLSECNFSGCKMKGVHLGISTIVAKLKCKEFEISPCGKYIAMTSFEKKNLQVLLLSSLKVLFVDNVYWNHMKFHPNVTKFGFVLIVYNETHMKVFYNDKGEKFKLFKYIKRDKFANIGFFYSNLILISHSTMVNEYDRSCTSDLYNLSLLNNDWEMKSFTNLKVQDGFCIDSKTNLSRKVYHFDTDLLCKGEWLELTIVHSDYFKNRRNAFFSNSQIKACAFVDVNNEKVIWILKKEQEHTKKYKIDCPYFIFENDEFHLYHYDETGLIFSCFLKSNGSILLWMESTQELLILNGHVKLNVDVYGEVIKDYRIIWNPFDVIFVLLNESNFFVFNGNDQFSFVHFRGLHLKRDLISSNNIVKWISPNKLLLYEIKDKIFNVRLIGDDILWKQRNHYKLFGVNFRNEKLSKYLYSTISDVFFWFNLENNLKKAIEEVNNDDHKIIYSNQNNIIKKYMDVYIQNKKDFSVKLVQLDFIRKKFKLVKEFKLPNHLDKPMNCQRYCILSSKDNQKKIIFDIINQKKSISIPDNAFELFYMFIENGKYFMVAYSGIVHINLYCTEDIMNHEKFKALISIKTDIEYTPTQSKFGHLSFEWNEKTKWLIVNNSDIKMSTMIKFLFTESKVRAEIKNCKTFKKMTLKWIVKVGEKFTYDDTYLMGTCNNTKENSKLLKKKDSKKEGEWNGYEVIENSVPFDQVLCICDGMIIFEYEKYIWKLSVDFKHFKREMTCIGPNMEVGFKCTNSILEGCEISQKNINAFKDHGALKTNKYTIVKDEQSFLIYNNIEKGGVLKKKQYPTKFAMVIGNSKYKEFTKLNNSINDATLMFNTLNELGFIVTKAFNEESEDLIDLFDLFVQDIQESIDPSFNNDIVIILYYAGHGYIFDKFGNEFILPIDCEKKHFQIDSKKFKKNFKLNEKLDIKHKKITQICLSLKKITFDLKLIPGGNRILFFDACRNVMGININNIIIKKENNNNDDDDGEITRGMGGYNVNHKKEIQKNRHLISFSTKKGCKSFDGKGGNSVYTFLLSSLLKKETNLGSILDELKEGVERSTKGNQIPMIECEYLGYFASFEWPPKSKFEMEEEKWKKRAKENWEYLKKESKHLEKWGFVKKKKSEVVEVPLHIHDNWNHDLSE